MAANDKIQGFSRLSREEKIRVAAQYALHPVEFAKEMFSNWLPRHNEEELQFTENSVSDFRLPYSVAPNFLINGKVYMVPMVTEESSVIAAASSAAKFWYDRGGFNTTVDGTVKAGHIHFMWYDTTESLNDFYRDLHQGIPESVTNITASMQARGGGIESVSLRNLTDKIDCYYQIEVLFHTADAMGANFINTCLETIADYMVSQAELKGIGKQLEIIMSILSNYSPGCLVKCYVSCKTSDLAQGNQSSGEDLARKFEIAVRIAQHDISRAATHNKGIFNGIDAVVLATGNDFRAVEAAGHSWACRTGTYRGLSEVSIKGDQFLLSLELPLPIGVTGGITNLHPLTRASLQLLGNPDPGTLMSVTASVGLANHFSAIKALISSGIQMGHMKLHLINILNQFRAGENERRAAIRHFAGRKVTYSGVRDFISQLRSN